MRYPLPSSSDATSATPKIIGVALALFSGILAIAQAALAATPLSCATSGWCETVKNDNGEVIYIKQIDYSGRYRRASSKLRYPNGELHPFPIMQTCDCVEGRYQLSVGTSEGVVRMPWTEVLPGTSAEHTFSHICR